MQTFVMNWFCCLLTCVAILKNSFSSLVCKTILTPTHSEVKHGFKDLTIHGKRKRNVKFECWLAWTCTTRLTI